MPAPEQQTPRIEPEPRWNPDVVRAYLKEQNAAYNAVPEPAIELPAPAPSAVPAPAPVQSAALAWDGEAPDLVIARLGPPTLDRRDGRIRMLQYARSGCILDVMLSRRAGATDFGVRSFAARTRAGASTNPLACLNGQLSARRQPRISLAVLSPPPIPPKPPAPTPATASLPSVPLLAPVPTAAAPPPPALVPGLSYPLGGAQ
jgi:hypothetical protein